MVLARVPNPPQTTSNPASNSISLKLLALLERSQNSVLERQASLFLLPAQVVSLSNFQPIMAIELDGKSHGSENQRRDAVKDQAFKSAGVPLVRIPVS